jgi:hypothetical protein
LVRVFNAINPAGKRTKSCSKDRYSPWRKRCARCRWLSGAVCGCRYPIATFALTHPRTTPSRLLIENIPRAEFPDEFPDCALSLAMPTDPTKTEMPITLVPQDLSAIGHVMTAAYLNWVQAVVIKHWEPFAPEAAQASLDRDQACHHSPCSRQRWRQSRGEYMDREIERDARPVRHDY